MNVIVTIVLTFVLNAVKAPAGVDETAPSDYTADAGDPGVKTELPLLPRRAPPAVTDPRTHHARHRPGRAPALPGRRAKNGRAVPVACGTLPSMDLAIRPVRTAEFADLGEITAQAYLGDGLLDFGADDPYLEQLRAVERRAAEAEVLVAVDADGRIAGRCHLRRARQPVVGHRHSGRGRVPHAGGLAVRPWPRGGRGARTGLYRAGTGRRRAAWDRPFDAVGHAGRPPDLPPPRLRTHSGAGLVPPARPRTPDVPPGALTPPRHYMWGLLQSTAPTCMLDLAVAAGESGANPELSRNGVIGAHFAYPKSEDLSTVRPARPNRAPRRPGPAEGRWTPCAVPPRLSGRGPARLPRSRRP